MDVDGWDLDAVGRIVRQAEPALAYLIPDFQNPTGNLMGDAQRERVRRPAAADRHRRRRRRVARGAGAGRGRHAAPVRVVRRRRDHPGQCQQEPLGGPADRLDPVSASARRDAGRRPGRPRPGVTRPRAAGRGPAARGGRDPRATAPRPPAGTARRARRSTHRASARLELPAARRRPLAVVRAPSRTSSRRRRPHCRGRDARGRGRPPAPCSPWTAASTRSCESPTPVPRATCVTRSDCLADAWAAVTTRADGRPDRPHRVMVA